MPGTRGLPHPAEVCPAASATHELWPRSLRSMPTPQNKTLPLPPPSLPPPSLSPSSSLDHPRRIKSNLINLLGLSRQIESEMVPRLCLLQLCEHPWARRSWARPSPQAWAARPGCRACGSLGLRKHHPPMEVGAEANRLNLAVKKVRSWLGEALRMFTRRVPVSWPHCTRSRGRPLSPLPGSHCGVARDRHRFRVLLPGRGSQRVHQKRIPTLSLTPAPLPGTQQGASTLPLQLTASDQKLPRKAFEVAGGEAAAG